MNSGDSPKSPPFTEQSATPDSTAERTLAWAKSQNFKIWFSRETTSTNTIAKSRVSSATERSVQPTLFLTERQTAGRGRGDHSWVTPRGALLSTWSYPLSFAPQPILSPLAGLALSGAAIEAFGDLGFNLKAPNDLYVGSKKIAGLLIENVALGEAVTCAVGLGFNAGDAPESLANQAAGLSEFLSDEQIENAWPKFLTVWTAKMSEALSQAKSPDLSETARAQLREALNLHPLLKEKVLNVGALGQIQTASRLINWSEL